MILSMDSTNIMLNASPLITNIITSNVQFDAIDTDPRDEGKNMISGL